MLMSTMTLGVNVAYREIWRKPCTKIQDNLKIIFCWWKMYNHIGKQDCISVECQPPVCHTTHHSVSIVYMVNRRGCPCTVRFKSNQMEYVQVPSCGQNDTLRRLKTLPCRNFVNGRQYFLQWTDAGIAERPHGITCAEVYVLKGDLLPYYFEAEFISKSKRIARIFF